MKLTTESTLFVAGAAAGLAAVAVWQRKKLRNRSGQDLGGSNRASAAQRSRGTAATQALADEPLRTEHGALPDEGKHDETADDAIIEPESPELPLGRSADPDIDHSLSHAALGEDDTSGANFPADTEAEGDDGPADIALDDAMRVVASEGERNESYDTVTPEDLGAVWLARATETTHDERPVSDDNSESADLAVLLVSESTIVASHLVEITDEADEADPEEADRREQRPDVADGIPPRRR